MTEKEDEESRLRLLANISEGYEPDRRRKTDYASESAILQEQFLKREQGFDKEKERIILRAAIEKKRAEWQDEAVRKDTERKGEMADCIKHNVPMIKRLMMVVIDGKEGWNTKLPLDYKDNLGDRQTIEVDCEKVLEPVIRNIASNLPNCRTHESEFAGQLFKQYNGFVFELPYYDEKVKVNGRFNCVFKWIPKV